MPKHKAQREIKFAKVRVNKKLKINPTCAITYPQSAKITVGQRPKTIKKLVFVFMNFNFCQLYVFALPNK